MYCKNFKFKKETPSSKKALALFIFSILAFANPVFAADIRISPLKSEIMFQEQFLANVVVGSEEPVNTIEGSLYFPDDLLSVSEIRTGDSVINFWVEKPHISAGGNISFSGGTPGGWSGPHNLIFSVVFEAKNNTGSASIVFGNIRAFQNDGMGTEMTLAGRSADIYIKKGNGMPTERLADHEMPEYFMPAIGEGAPVFNGKKFLVFATQDKISGVNRYEVKESWWAGYKVAEKSASRQKNLRQSR